MVADTSPSGMMIPMPNQSNSRDVFVCHASEDKASVVEPLVAAFDAAGISFWYDKAEIRWGDSLIRKINDGLASSSFVIVILSKTSIEKHGHSRNSTLR
jgi:hypothetical protein